MPPVQIHTPSSPLSHGQIIHALRLAVTGKAAGFGLFESLEILGKPQCLTRIERARV